VIAYDRLIKDSDLDLYMSFDNVRVGEEQAKYLLAHLPTPGKGKLVRVFGSKTDNNAFLFKQGQDNILKPYIERGDIKILHEDWAEDWKPDNGKKIVNAAITKYGKNFDGILAANDGTAGGAIQALTEEGLAKKILVTGQDAELVACQRIVGGTQVMTVYKPLRILATRAAEVAVDVAKGKIILPQATVAKDAALARWVALGKVIAAKDEVDNGKIKVPSILCDVVPVDKDNMMDTVIKDGHLKQADVYTGAAAPSTGK
jgi:D-xylose transport system substrate-binding protein